MMDKKKIREIEPGWETASTLSQLRGGHSYVWERRMKELRERLIKKLKEDLNLTTPVAEYNVEMRYVGMRKKNGRLLLAISQEAAGWLEDYKWLEAGESQGGDLAREHGGSRESWNKRILKHGEELASEIVELGVMNQEEADAFVYERFAGKRNRSSAMPAPALTEAGKRSMPIYPLLDANFWITGSALEDERGRSSSIWNKAIKQFYFDSIAKREAEHGEEKEVARAYVEEHMAGKRRYETGGPLPWAVHKDYVGQVVELQRAIRSTSSPDGKRGK